MSDDFGLKIPARTKVAEVLKAHYPGGLSSATVASLAGLKKSTASSVLCKMSAYGINVQRVPGTGGGPLWRWVAIIGLWFAIAGLGLASYDLAYASSQDGYHGPARKYRPLPNPPPEPARPPDMQPRSNHEHTDGHHPIRQQ